MHSSIHYLPQNAPPTTSFCTEHCESIVQSDSQQTQGVMYYSPLWKTEHRNVKKKQCLQLQRSKANTFLEGLRRSSRILASEDTGFMWACEEAVLHEDFISTFFSISCEGNIVMTQRLGSEEECLERARQFWGIKDERVEKGITSQIKGNRSPAWLSAHWCMFACVHGKDRTLLNIQIKVLQFTGYVSFHIFISKTSIKPFSNSCYYASN